MAVLFKFTNPIRIDKQTMIGHTLGAETYVHWSVFAVAALILAGVMRHPDYLYWVWPPILAS